MPSPVVFRPTARPPVGLRRPASVVVGGLAVGPYLIPYSWLSPPLPSRHDKPITTAQVSTSAGTVAYREDAAAVAEYGDNPLTVTLNTANAVDAANLAAWTLSYYATQAGDFPRTRFSSLRICLSKRTVAEQQSFHENATIGRHIRITDPPTTWPTGAADQVVEGIHHLVGDIREVELLTSPIIGSAHGVAGPWFRADSSTVGGTDVVPY